jgi:hypothetical protein
MARLAHWCHEVSELCGAGGGDTSRAMCIRGASRANSHQCHASGNLPLQWFRSSASRARTLSATFGVCWVPLIQAGPRRAWLHSAKKSGRVRGHLEFESRSGAAVRSRSSGVRQVPWLRPALVPNHSMNRTPNPLRGFGTLAALGAGYLHRWAN